MFIGVPVILGSNGVEKIIELELTGEEKGTLHKTAADIKALVEKVA